MSPNAKYLLGTVGACILAASGPARTQDATPLAVAPTVARSAGQMVYAKWCGDCHGTPTGPGSLALQRKYHGDRPAILEQRRDLSAAYVRLAVRHGVSFMPSFRKTEISDRDVAFLGAYLAPPREPTKDATKQP